ncbi:Serine/threonine-protein kinase 19 [Mortierella sp. GBA43]|nr:Serine/threonine-protein kinase 19 [Mortierella sp. GBA43]
MAFRKSTQQRRHQMLAAASLGSFHPRPASTAKTQTSSDNDYPKDTLSAIHYLMDLLQPQKVKQQKVFPRVCMVHQLYSIIKDNTAVDRTLAHLIKENKVRKFFLGGTGSDEFAIMFTSDYVTQIQQAKEQYLKDLEKSDHSSGGSLQGSLKRKAPHGSSPTTTRSPTINKKVIVASSPVGSPTATSIKACSSPSTTASGDQGHSEGEIFDRFRELIQSGQCLEISIQNSNIQSVIGATDQDIT